MRQHYCHRADRLIIELKGDANPLRFEIVNAAGQVVFRGDVTEKTVVQTSEFLPGVYLLKLGNGKTFEFRKILKE